MTPVARRIRSVSAAQKGEDDVDVFHDELGIDEPQTIDPAAVRLLDDLDSPADGLPVAHAHG